MAAFKAPPETPPVILRRATVMPSSPTLTVPVTPIRTSQLFFPAAPPPTPPSWLVKAEQARTELKDFSVKATSDALVKTPVKRVSGLDISAVKGTSTDPSTPLAEPVTPGVERNPSSRSSFFEKPAVHTPVAVVPAPTGPSLTERRALFTTASTPTKLPGSPVVKTEPSTPTLKAPVSRLAMFQPAALTLDTPVVKTEPSTPTLKAPVSRLAMFQPAALTLDTPTPSGNAPKKKTGDTLATTPNPVNPVLAAFLRNASPAVQKAAIAPTPTATSTKAGFELSTKKVWAAEPSPNAAAKSTGIKRLSFIQ